MLKPIESTDYSRATTVVYTQEYPTTRSMFGISQMSRLTARGLPIVSPLLMFVCLFVLYLGCVVGGADVSNSFMNTCHISK